MYVICKSCDKKFSVFPPNSDLNLGGGTLDLHGGNVNTNKLTFGNGGRVNFGNGGTINFSQPPPAKYRCPHCGEEHEYSPDEIFND